MTNWGTASGDVQLWALLLSFWQRAAKVECIKYLVEAIVI
jgi:hypothetical protein